MKKYEAIIIFNPNLSSKVGEFTKKFEKTLSENSFSVKKCEDIGRRQLSYSINNHNKGHYLIFNIEGDPIKLIDVEEHNEGDSQLFLDSKNNKHEIEDDNETASKSKDSQIKQDDEEESNKDSQKSEENESSNEDQKKDPSIDNIDDKEKDDE